MSGIFEFARGLWKDLRRLSGTQFQMDGNIEGQFENLGNEKMENEESICDNGYSLEDNVFLYSNCDAYAGEWQMSKRNGWGVYLKYTGQKFEGLWKDNIREGFGMQTIGNTIKYIGQFNNNECDGEGVIFHQSGLLYSSKWSGGELIERKLLFDRWKEGLLELFDYTAEKEVEETKTRDGKTFCSLERLEAENSCTFKEKVKSDLENLNGDLSKDLNLDKISETGSRTDIKVDFTGDKKRCEWKNGNSKQNMMNLFHTLSNEMGNKSLKCYSLENSAESCLNWSIYHIAYYIKCIGLPKYTKLFILNEIDGSVLPYIGIDDLREMGIKDIPHLKYIHMSFTLLLKLRLRCIRKQTFSPQKLIDDEYLKSFEIPAGELSLKCRIGEGGYGKVYKALWVSRGITVAVKAFRRRDKVALAREFYSELTIISRIRHPNVTLFLGVVMSPLYCLVTELVPNGSLFDLLHGKNTILTSTQLLKISKEICCGMAYLHENGVLHCDLKSSNILLSKNFNVKIGDFGLSTLMDSPLETRKMLGCVGTHHWMAPEILRGEGFTKSADVYSFGIILWEMITKKIPHEDLNVNHIIASVGYGSKRPIIPENIPSAIKIVIQKTWDKNVGKRPSFKQLTSVFEKLYQSSILDIEENLLAFFGQ
ncbi:TKL protein kinase [Cryptosporidium felis]|nr:TKL protein kinase [Cryptosporidium felis]